MAQNNDGPGKRLKREEAKFIKPTTQDSLDLYNQAQVINKFYGSNPMYTKGLEMPFEKYLKKHKTNYKELLKEPDSMWGLRLLSSPSNIKAIKEEFGKETSAQKLVDKFKNKGIFKAYPNLLEGHYDTYTNPDVPPIYLHPSIKPHSVIAYGADEYMDAADVPKYDPIAIKPVSMLTPKERIEREKKYGAISPVKRPIIERRATEIVEPLQPRQAPSPIFSREEIIAPVPRPVPQSNLEPQDGSMGFAMRYPAQTFMNKMKARMSGQPNMPYWVDREGVKRYPSMGENSPEEVRMIDMLKKGLSPSVPEDASELKRIDLLRKMSPKDRRKYMDSERIAQK